ncbi:MAG: ubiquinone/menaquinone biosynthesis methyltransferase [Spirochaetes bacterium]|nr:ubiquinone/menaquinone biosynthesis methyltransferase [Spirochaetota bacterium]
MKYQVDNDNPHGRKAKIRSMFDAIVDGYDRANRILSFGIDQLWRKKVVEQCECSQKDVVLDICCGTGDLSALIRATGAHVVSLDFSYNMIQKGREKGNIDELATVADASRLPFKDAIFTKVCVSFGIRNIPDIDIFLEEVYRVLRPGGTFIILELTRPRYNIFRLLYFFYLYTILPIVGGIIAGSFNAYRYLSKTIHTFIDPLTLTAMQEKHGFIDIQCKSMTLSIATMYISKKPPVDTSFLSLPLSKHSHSNSVIIH